MYRYIQVCALHPEPRRTFQDIKDNQDYLLYHRRFFAIRNKAVYDVSNEEALSPPPPAKTESGKEEYQPSPNDNLEEVLNELKALWANKSELATRLVHLYDRYNDLGKDQRVLRLRQELHHEISIMEASYEEMPDKKKKDKNKQAQSNKSANQQANKKPDPSA